MEDVATYAIMRILGPAFTGLAMSFLLWTPLVLYVLARWRLAREPGGDPQHGLKFALHYFSALALQVALASIALLLSSIVSSGASMDRSQSVRMAFGMLVPAGGVLAGYFVLVRRTNDAQFPGLCRMFTGFHLVVTGGVAFLALMVGFQLLFQKGDTHGVGRLALVVIVVYSAATVLLARLLVRSEGRILPSRSEAAATAVAPARTPALPTLGGGEYPPLAPTAPGLRPGGSDADETDPAAPA